MLLMSRYLWDAVREALGRPAVSIKSSRYLRYPSVSLSTMLMWLWEGCDGDSGMAVSRIRSWRPHHR